MYICGYGFVRFFIEFFREPDYQLGFVLGFLSMGQVLCLLMMVTGTTYHIVTQTGFCVSEVMWGLYGK